MASLAFAGTNAAAQDNKLTVMVDWSAHGMHSGLHLAVQKSWFQEAELDVDCSTAKARPEPFSRSVQDRSKSVSLSSPPWPSPAATAFR